MKNKIISCMCSLVLVPLFYSVTVQAAIYKCTNASKEVYYNDKPCPVNDIERQLKEVKDPVNGYIPPAYKASTSKELDLRGTSKNKSIQSAAKATDREDSNDKQGANKGSGGGSGGGSSGEDTSSDSANEEDEDDLVINNDSGTNTANDVSSISNGTLNIINKESRE